MLSRKAITLIKFTIYNLETTDAATSSDQQDLLAIHFWNEVLRNPQQYKKLVRQIEDQASKTFEIN